MSTALRFKSVDVGSIIYCRRIDVVPPTMSENRTRKSERVKEICKKNSINLRSSGVIRKVNGRLRE